MAAMMLMSGKNPFGRYDSYKVDYSNPTEGRQIETFIGLASGITGIARSSLGKVVPNNNSIPSYEKLLSQAKNDLDFGTPRDGAVFWSSNDTTSNMRIAQDWAAEQRGKYTLEQTKGGQYLTELNLFGPDSGLTPQQAARIWDAASLRFVNEASGDLNVFSTRAKKLSKYGHIRTWWRIEKDALINNDDVTSVTRRKLDGSESKTGHIRK